jgi:hypothetical protein
VKNAPPAWNFIIGAERTRRCLIASCCAGNVIARRISAERRHVSRAYCH